MEIYERGGIASSSPFFELERSLSLCFEASSTSDVYRPCCPSATLAPSTFRCGIFLQDLVRTCRAIHGAGA